MGKSKVLNGRVATEADVENGSVVFYVPDSRSTPYQFDHKLPLIAKIIKPVEGLDVPSGSLVTIVQAEQADNGDILLGLLLGHGGEAVCVLGEVEVIGPASDDSTSSI